MRTQSRIAFSVAAGIALTVVFASVIREDPTGPAGTPGRPPSPSSSAPPQPPSTAPAPPATTAPVPNASGPITYYAARDNDPPGTRQIAYPGILHKEAGGTGTFQDPLTFAAAKGSLKPGTKIYVPEVRRYFILEDTCASCSGSHIDLWTGPAADRGVLGCEEALTRDGPQPYEVNPPAGRPVIPGDLYQNGRCFQP